MRSGGSPLGVVEEGRVREGRNGEVIRGRPPSFFGHFLVKTVIKKQYEKQWSQKCAPIATKGSKLCKKVIQSDHFGVIFGAILGSRWNSENRVPAAARAQFSRFGRVPKSTIFYMFIKSCPKCPPGVDFSRILAAMCHFGVSIGSSKATKIAQKSFQSCVWNLQGTPFAPRPTLGWLLDLKMCQKGIDIV